MPARKTTRSSTAAKPRKQAARYTIGFIGGGNMATAMIKGFVAAGVCAPAQICASDVDAAKRAALQRTLKVHATADNAAVVRDAQVIVLAVKPQIIDAVLAELRPSVTPRKLFVSIAAGIPTSAPRARPRRGCARRARHAEHAGTARQGHVRRRARPARDRSRRAARCSSCCARSAGRAPSPTSANSTP